MDKVVNRCDKCGSVIDEREIALYRGLISELYRVYQWLLRRGGGYRFDRKEIKHLFRSENTTARFGDLVMFGGIVFKESKAHYGINIERCEAFFRNEYKIPTRIWKNPITGELRPEDYRTITQIPRLIEKLNDEGFYEPIYREPVKK